MEKRSANIPGSSPGLTWPPLIRGTLVKRYKRFLADIRLVDGTIITAHCTNSGRMDTCSQPGRPVYISRATNPKRKLKYTWELIEMPGSLVGVNTLLPNRLVADAIATGQVAALTGYTNLKREVSVGERSRLDICLSGGRRRRCYVEVKNCTLVKNGRACFPDAVTTRGLKHLNELQNLVRAGHRGVIFFLIQRMDATVFSPADPIDPDYGKGLRQAVCDGVEILVFDVFIDLNRICLRREIAVDLNRKPIG